MGIKRVSVYEASDGKQFPTIAEAQAHDACAKVMAKIRIALQNPKISGQVPSTLAIDLTNDPKIATDLRDALNKALEYHRNYGKLRGKKQTATA